MGTKGTTNRESIVAIADELFYRHGYSRTSFSDIASAVGIPKGNFYYYFKSKDELLAAVLEQRVRKIADQLASWEKQGHSLHTRLSRFVRMVRDNADNLSHFGCPMGSINTELGKDLPPLQQQARRMFDIYLDWLSHQLREHFSAKQARQHAEQLMAMVQGASLLGHAYQDPALIRRQTRLIENWLNDLLRT